MDKDELARAAATEGSSTFKPTSIVSRAPTPAPATTSVFAPSLDKKLFKQFIKAYLETQVLGQTEVDPEPHKKPFKARFPGLYYDNLHIGCYQFCQQCEDHFETTRAKKYNKIVIAALFLHRLVIQQWPQHK